MKILIVKYLPSGAVSNTGLLLEHFKQKIGRHLIEEIDLVQNLPPVFNIESLAAYKLRNIEGKILSPEQAQAIAPMDKLTAQFKSAQLVVFAFPMHNFSLPGAVKCYVDAIMQQGQVFTHNGEQRVGLMKLSKVLVVYTSMGAYKAEYGFMDNVKTIMNIELDFMGFEDIEYIQASTGNKTTREIHLNNAKKSIENVVQKWKL